MLVIAVRLDVHPDSRHAFRGHILENAAQSLDREPGCKRFDVCFSDDGASCFLYEVYEDEAAFDAHRKTDHYAEFGRKTEGMITDKRVERYLLAVSGD